MNNDQPARKPMDHRNGHSAILATMVKNKTMVKFVMINGNAHHGVITQFDNYTVTVSVELPGGLKQLRTLYKHAVEYFAAS